MQRTQDDQWSSNPFTVKSFFRYNPSSLKDGQTVVSPLCGLGWQYQFTSEYGHYPSYAYEKKMYFSPGRLEGASLDGITLATCITSGDNTSRHSLNVSFRHVSWVEVYGLSEMKETDFVFSLQLPEELNETAPSSPGLENLLRDSFQGDELLDSKFWLFSKHVAEGIASCPKPIYASSRFFGGQSEYLDLLITSPGFTESVSVNIDAEDSHHKLSATDFTCEDSDLESDDDDELPIVKKEESANKPSGEGALKAFKHEVSSKPALASRKTVRYGRVISLNDTAFRTFHSFLWYLYTGKTSFLPLRSLPKLEQRLRKPKDIPCSPKSMYRLAHKFEIEKLQTLSLTAIKSNMRESNVVSEFSSQLASIYPPIREIAMNFMIENFTPIVQKDFNQLVRTKLERDSPRFNHDMLMSVILRLYGRFSKKEIIDLATINDSGDGTKKEDVKTQ